MPLQLSSNRKNSKRDNDLSESDKIARIDDIFNANGYQSVVIRQDNV